MHQISTETCVAHVKSEVVTQIFPELLTYRWQKENTNEFCMIIQDIIQIMDVHMHRT